MMKRFFALMLSATMVMGLLAGCGNSNTADTTADTVSGESAAAADTTAASGEVIELSFPSIWVGTDSKAAVFQQMVSDFNAEYEGQYHIKVEEQTDYDMYRDKLRTQISTGSAPDIFTVDTYSDLSLFASSGQLMDLTEFLQEEDINSRFLDGQIELGQVDGVNYGFPYETAVISIMFNEELLKAAGVEEIPTTFEDFWDACEKLSANDMAAVCQMTGDNAIFSCYWYTYLLVALGGEDVFDNGFDDPAYAQAAELMLKMFDYTTSDAIGGGATEANGHFFNERAAIYANGTWILGRIKNEGVEGLYDNLVPSQGLSINDENGGSMITSTQAFFCAAKQDDPAKEEAVKAFFSYITQPEKVGELADSSGALFAINFDTALLSDKLQAQILELCASASFTHGHFNSVMPTTVVNAFPAALEGLVLGDLTPEEFVEELKAAQ